MRYTSLPTTPSFIWPLQDIFQTVRRSLTLCILLFSNLLQHRQTMFFPPKYDTVTKDMPMLYLGLKTRAILNWSNLNLISLLEKWGLNLSFSMKSQIERYSRWMIQFSCLSAWCWERHRQGVGGEREVEGKGEGDRTLSSNVESMCRAALHGKESWRCVLCTVTQKWGEERERVTIT